MRYVSKMLAHGLKAEQAPPVGWRGHRTSQTRGYLVRPASVMRDEARRRSALSGVSGEQTSKLARHGGDVEALYDQLTAAEADGAGAWALHRTSVNSHQGVYVAPLRSRDTGKVMA